MSETVAIIDYGSGNLRSAEKAIARAGEEADLVRDVIVTADPDVVAKADRVVLPGVGAFADCKQGLSAINGMIDAITESVVNHGQPFLGICVGMQLMAREGHEFGIHPGFGWIDGTVKAFELDDPSLKIPHMGWNKVNLSDAGQGHPVANAITGDDHAYFVHSFHMELNDGPQKLASTHHGMNLTAIVGRDNMIGTQFHPEKSQDVGQKFLKAFLEWKP